MLSTYTYLKTANIAQLSNEITASTITVALESITSNNLDILISFKAALSAEEQLVLDILVADHVPEEVQDPDIVKMSSRHMPEDDTLVVYATTIPMGHHVCFQGSGDTDTVIGAGEKMAIHMTSRDTSKTVDITFNENVYIKDGYMITRDAPFGASIDIDIVHPTGALIMKLAAKVPVFGTGWFPLDTDGRALLPKGIIMRVTLHNSDGGTEVGQSTIEQPPADFWLSGRFELYRKFP